MNHKKVNLFFEETLAGFDIELHDSDCFSVALTDYRKNEDKSDESLDVIEPRFVAEVFVGADEIKSIIKGLQYLLDEDDAS